MQRVQRVFNSGILDIDPVVGGPLFEPIAATNPFVVFLAGSLWIVDLLPEIVEVGVPVAAIVARLPLWSTQQLLELRIGIGGVVSLFQDLFRGIAGDAAETVDVAHPFIDPRFRRIGRWA